jgi:gliding motility-associated-like protein
MEKDLIILRKLDNIATPNVNGSGALTTNNTRNQMFMKMIKKTAWLFLLPLLFVVGQVNLASAQSCNPKYTGAECVGAPISFTANSPGFNYWTWEFGDGNTSAGDQPANRDPSYVYTAPGTYKVKLTANHTGGAFPDCVKEITVVIKPSPVANLLLINQQQQCFERNSFCYVDSSSPAAGSSIVRRTLLFSDGAKYDKINPSLGDTICHTVIDPKGGWFDLTIELEDANGCVSKVKITDAIRVWPRLGVKISSNQPTGCDSTLATITNSTYIDWLSKPFETIGLKDISEFVFDFGDGTIVRGDSITNTDYWTGKDKDGKVKYMYRKNGTFNAVLRVTSKFGCTESYTYKAAATNISINPVIVANFDSTCTSEPETCFKLVDGPIPGARFLWTFGDPPSGLLNFDQRSWTPCHNYGGGPWMISLRVLSGPCDIMVYDTILKVGPASTIEIPFVRVLESEKYQCTIEDSVHFVNNSSFYHDDENYWDESTMFMFFEYSFAVVKHVVTGEDSIYTYRNMDTLITKYALTDTLNKDGYTMYFDQAKDSFLVTDGVDTTYYAKTRGGLDPERHYVFNYDDATRTGDQTAIPLATPIRLKTNVLRLWSLGDTYAPQCTTDTKANKNVNLNCNFTLDSLPIHWYTPWDDIYKYDNNGQRYTTPAPKTLFSKNARQCYRVSIYAGDTMVVPQEVVIFVPKDSTRTFYIPYVDSFGVAKIDTVVIETNADSIYAEHEFRDNYRLRIWRPETFYTDREDIYSWVDTSGTTFYDTVYVPVKNTVIWEDQEYFVPSGVSLPVKDLTNAFYRTVNGPRTETIDLDEQFEVPTGDTIFSRSSITINAERTVIAAASQILVDTTINGIDTFYQKAEILIDSAFHRDYFYQNVARCNTVTLWHKDTIHPLECESASNISLALIPPNARGLTWESGIPCPLDGNKLTYYLVFNMSETKPGCTQQWFEVNYDSLTGPNNWVSYLSGGVLAPPPPGTPLPFVMPYDIVGAWGTSFTKGYSSGEVGSDPDARPNGSFTLGLVIGNGPPQFNAQGDPIAPECTDTAWYSDMFRYQYLDAQFDILVPKRDVKAICAGETAYFRLLNPIQDSMSALRWNWGYPDRLSGYYEEFAYFQEYKGPVSGRNDADVQWNGEKWLYNYVIRHDLDEVFGDEVIDTLVTRIYRDWMVEINTYRADKILIDLLEALDLDIRDIPPDELPLMLGDGTVGCIDTTGLSQYFVISKKGINENVVHHDDGYKYQYTDTFKTDSVIIEQSLHFRDTSMQGFDTLVAPYDIVTSDGILFKKGQKIPGVYKFEYKHAVVKLNFCDPTKKDTIMVKSNGPMIPGIFLNNTTGCEKSGAKLLNVGFLNLFKLKDAAVCQGQVHILDDSIRYWQYGDQAYPNDYPIDPTKFWEDPQRYLNNREIKAIDWDLNDGDDQFDRSVKFSHVYDDPGEYLMAIAMKDSIGCTDTAYVTAFVTGVKANFETNIIFDKSACKNIVSFFDSTVVFDPCRGRDTCPNSDYDPCDSIVWYEWDFGDGSTRSVLKNPAHDFTSNGYFTITLKVYSLLGCEDSIQKTIFVSGPQPEFEFDGFNPWGADSVVICVGDTVALNNISKEPMFDPDFIMYWGDDTITNFKNANDQIKHAYRKVGTYYLSLYQTDEVEGTGIRCGSLFPDTSTIDGKIAREIKVIVKPIAEASFTISDDTVCRFDEVIFTSTSDTTYKYFTWDFGDRDTATRSVPEYSVSHSYDSVGNYTIKLIPDYDLPPQDFGPKCIDTAYGVVNVVDIKANFDIKDDDKPEFCFKDKSTGSDPALNQWIIETEDRSKISVFEPNTCFNWGETIGTFEVCLIATSPEGCKDSICRDIDNDFVARITPHNVFTPDGDDEINKFFVIDVEGWEEYNIVIHNRWGELVFKADTPDDSWDGTILNKGTKCPSGTYFYVINYKLKNRAENDGLKPISGIVTLIR